MGPKLGLGTIAVLLLSGLSAPWSSAQALQPSRITRPIRCADQMQIKGTIHPMVARAQDQGELSGSTPMENMSLVFGLSAAQQADLKSLLQQQQTRAPRCITNG